MADRSRIEELRRRVQKDPASIAFAQLGEEYRRAGHYQEAIETCRAGLDRHPGYLSARVTLGRALIEVNDLVPARAELEIVLRAAPENLAAIRGLAEIHYRRGELAESLQRYRAALALARHDPDLEQTVADMTRELEPARSAVQVPGGLSFEQARAEFLSASALFEPPPKRTDTEAPPAPDARNQHGAAHVEALLAEMIRSEASAPLPAGDGDGDSVDVRPGLASELAVATSAHPAEPPATPVAIVGREDAGLSAVPALESFLAAILASRQCPRA